MSVILYINGQRIDTDSKTVIAQTKQVNDIANLSNRQCNFTNKIKIPKTANNVKALNYMAVPGNTSSIPYQKNECFLQSANGQVFVHKGWAVVADGGDYYNVTIYDGIIDLFKEIENKNLSDVVLNDLDHDKTVANVIDSWSLDDRDYRYLVADYNGDTGDTENGEINIDYLVPSVWIPYLWEKIRTFLSEKFNKEVTFEGSVFNSTNFRTLYMSYPKGLATSDSEEVIFSSSDTEVKAPPAVISISSWWIKYNTSDVYEISSDIEGIHLRVPQTGIYRLEVYGTVKASSYYGGSWNGNSALFFGIDVQNEEDPSEVSRTNENTFSNSIPNNTEIAEGELSKVVELESGQYVTFFQGAQSNQYSTYIAEPENLTIKMTLVTPNPIDFGNALENFSIKDFMSEIINRFGLTIFKDSYSQNYTFLTMEEFLQNAESLDWSDKYIKTISENYASNGYAQRNYLRYKYDNKESNYNDGYIGINNKNLPDKKDIYKSKIYSPERFSTTYFGNRLTNTYKLWDKEIKQEDGETTTKYKQLDGRFFIMQANYLSNSVVGIQNNYNVISKTLGQTDTANGASFEAYNGQTFPEIIQNYYQPISKILDRSIKVTVEMWLTDDDVINFDFKKRYYIKQLGNYFIVNKINNYITGKPTKVELIRVIYAGEEELTGYEYGITLTNAAVFVSGTIPIIHIEYNLQYTPQVGTELTFETSQNGQDWQSTGFTATTYQSANIPLSYLAPNQQYIRVHDITANVYSNTYFIQQ